MYKTFSNVVIFATFVVNIVLFCLRLCRAAIAAGATGWYVSRGEKNTTGEIGWQKKVRQSGKRKWPRLAEF